jgi:hypothetical protein
MFHARHYRPEYAQFKAFQAIEICGLFSLTITEFCE